MNPTDNNSRKPFFSIIYAVSKNGVLGNEGKIPWKVEGELARFKKITLGHTIVMGRKTYESIGGALPGRRNLVLTRNPLLKFKNAETILKPEDAFLKNEGNPPEIFVIGGGEIYELVLPQVKKIYQSEIQQDFAGDTRIPFIDFSCFIKEFEEKISSNIDYVFSVFLKKK